jgi:hypothetical protein
MCVSIHYNSDLKIPTLSTILEGTYCGNGLEKKFSMAHKKEENGKSEDSKSREGILCLSQQCF